MMSKVPYDRKVKLVSAEEARKNQTNYFSQFQAQHSDGLEPSSGVLVTEEERKQILKAFMSEPSFESKKKKELEILLKSQVFTEAVVRFRMPDGGYIEALFSPLETIADLKKVLQPVYLSMV